MKQLITLKELKELFSSEQLFRGDASGLIYEDIYDSDYDCTIVHHFGNWVLVLPNDFDDSQIKAYYRKLWDNYYKANKHNIDVLLTSYLTEYNPLDNYNRESTVTIEHIGTETNTLNGGGSNNYGIDTSNVINQVSPEDNDTLYNTEKSVAVRESKTDTFTNNNSNVRSFDNRKDVTTESAHGSIGTLAPIDMIKKELDARFYDLLYHFIELFIRREFI